MLYKLYMSVSSDDPRGGLRFTTCECEWYHGTSPALQLLGDLTA